MRDYVVRVVDTAGNVRWITLHASRQADAREKVSLSGLGYTAQGVFDNFDDARFAYPAGTEGSPPPGNLPELGTLPAGQTGTPAGSFAPGGGGDNDLTLHAGGLSYEDINASFRRALAGRGLIGLGQQAVNPAQRFALGRSGTAISALRGSDALNAITGNENVSAEAAESFFGENFGRFGEVSGDLFNQLGSLAQNRELAPAGAFAASGGQKKLLNLINPGGQEEGLASAGLSFDLARSAFLRNVSPLVGRALTRRDSAASALSDYNALTGGVTGAGERGAEFTQGGGAGFLEALRRRFGLEAFA